MKKKDWLLLVGCSIVASGLNVLGTATASYGLSLVNALAIPGESTDLSPLKGGGGANVNRLGFFSDLHYERHNNVYYALGDQGPGDGFLNYKTRVQKFSLDVDQNTGAISSFKLIETILFTKNGEHFNGLNPKLLNGDAGILGLSFDPEGFAVAPNGNFYVAEEFGPSIYEFTPTGSFVREFAMPKTIIPNVNGNPNYVAGRPILTGGRQEGRGFEGLTLSPNGRKLFAMLQDPLINEGAPDERRSRNLRIVEFDTATGQSSAQYIYQLENLTEINERIPGTANDIEPNAQGRNIGINAIAAINDLAFLVLERDSRGVGETDALGKAPVGSKRVYKIDLTNATNISGISLVGTNALPDGVIPVTKSLFFDVAELLIQAGLVVPAKPEGLTIGPKLKDGSYAILVGTDNDFSVTQTGGIQLDVCRNGMTAFNVPVDKGCPTGHSLIPGYLYSFKASDTELAGFVPLETVPEPGTTSALALLGLGSFWLRRRK